MAKVQGEGSLNASTYTWLPSWEGQWEGPMSLLLKFGWANCLPAHVLCETLFGCRLIHQDRPNLHSRTLVAPQWAIAGDHKEAAPLAKKIAASGLDHFMASWVRTLASDAHLRFCPACFELGYQSALFQIDALVVCPIHGEFIQEKCLHCGAPTPRYALTKASLETPFHCCACKKPYGGSFQPNAWKSISIDKEATAVLIPLIRWLKALQESSLTWLQWEDWWGPWLDDQMKRERRIATFNALVKMIDVDIDMKCFKSPALPVRVSVGKLNSELGAYGRSSLTGIALDEEKSLSRQSIYKSIRRYIFKRLAGLSQARVQRTIEPTDVSSTDQTLILSLKKCMKTQCITLWRLHFEEVGALVARSPGAFHLRPAALNWPWNGSVDDSGWAEYVLASLFASIEAVRAWQSKAITLQDTDLYGTDRAHAMSLFSEFAPYLNVKRFPVFPQISVATTPGVSKQFKEILFVVGPGARIDGGSYFPLCARNKYCVRCWRRPPSVTMASGVKICRAEHNSEITRVKQIQRKIAILPMERLVLPPDLDGSSGPHREMDERCRISAKSDLEAIEHWLNSMKKLENTIRVYRREVERCLLWTVCERKKPLSALDADDTNEYGKFLLNPQPADRWISTGYVGRSADNWAPFRGPLSSSSRDFSIRVVKLFFEWLCLQGYITLNPWVLSHFGASDAPRRDLSPAIAAPPRTAIVSLEEWHYIALGLDVGAFDLRQRLLVYLAYFATLKPRDLMAITNSSCRQLTSGKNAIWQMTVPKRRDGRTTIYLLPPVRDALVNYFGWYASSTAGAGNSPIRPDLPLFVTGPEIRSASLSSIVKPVFVAAASLAERDGKTHMAQRLKRAALGWLSNALEVHAMQQPVCSDWPWRLLGATRTVPTSFMRYLSDCTNLPESDVLHGFEALQSLWPSINTKATLNNW